MENAPLQPLRFWIESSSFELVDDYQPQPNSRVVPLVRIDMQIGVGQLEDGTDAYRHRLTITAPAEPDTRVPYRVKLVVSGSFVFINEVQLDEETKRHQVATSGLALTYGFARDALLQQTALGVHGPFMLPAVFFTQDSQRIIDEWSDITPIHPEDPVAQR
jgi:preprotein translocase subunit SecB